MTPRFSRVFFALLVAVAALGAAAQTADLSVTQTPSSNSFLYDTPFSVSIMATNLGATTTNARVTYSVTNGAIIDTNAPGWTCAAPSMGSVACSYPNLAYGQTAPILTVRAKPTNVGTQSLTSRAEIVSQTVSDSNAANDASQTTHDVKYATVCSFSNSVTGYYNEPTTLRATVSNPSGIRVYPGNIVFRVGETVLGTVPVTTGGVATLVTSSLPAGSNLLAAEFVASGNYAGSAGGAWAHILHRSTTTVTSSANPWQYGPGLTFTATVTSTSGTTPKGVVAFYPSGRAYTKVRAINGVATWTPSLQPPGSFGVTAVFEPDSGTYIERSISPVLTQTVTKGDATVALTSSDASSTYGEAVTFTATVSGAGKVPTGYLTFSRDGVAIRTFALETGVASLTLTTPPVGRSQITANYNGSPIYEPAVSSPLDQTVVQATTSTTLASAVNPTVYGQQITLTAAVTASSGAAVVGPVRFYRGTAFLGTAHVSNQQATYTTATVPAGTHAFQAVFAGTTGFATSSSDPITQTVHKSSTTTSVASSVAESVAGDSVTLTANVTAAYGAAARGSVTFKAGTAALRTVGLSSGAAAFTTSTLRAGVHSITAVYNGSVNMEPSTSPAATVTVKRRLDATITAQLRLCDRSTGNTASAPAQSGAAYSWSIQGGTITSGAGTNRVTFSPAAWVTSTTLDVIVSCDGCATATDSHDVSVGSNGGVTGRDFSGDGDPDLVWQNRSTGATQIWFMIGGSQPGRTADIASPPAGWAAEGLADVNRDANADVIYRNTQTGAVMVWLMNGLSNVGSMTFAAPTDLAWKLGGIGDFNCDGHADVVWHNTATRANAIWLMNYNELLSVAPLKSMSSGWTMEGVGDFNSDSRGDIVWRRSSDGRLAVWTMNGLAVTGTLYPPPQFDLNWSLDSVGDYSSDGRPDLVWRNTTTGANEMWFMNGITRTEIVPLMPVYDQNMVIGGPK